MSTGRGLFNAPVKTIPTLRIKSSYHLVKFFFFTNEQSKFTIPQKHSCCIIPITNQDPCPENKKHEGKTTY